MRCSVMIWSSRPMSCCETSAVAVWALCASLIAGLLPCRVVQVCSLLPRLTRPRGLLLGGSLSGLATSLQTGFFTQLLQQLGVADDVLQLLTQTIFTVGLGEQVGELLAYF